MSKPSPHTKNFNSQISSFESNWDTPPGVCLDLHLCYMQHVATFVMNSFSDRKIKYIMCQQAFYLTAVD